jgi:predicted DNA-binding transcriptional regulator AlpA
MNRVLGENTISYSTDGTYVRIFALSTKEITISIVLELEGGFSLDDHIALVLSEEPFLSAPQVAVKVMISKSTVYRHLTQTMRRKSRHLQGDPHSWTQSEKMNRVQRATELLALLQSIRRQEW